MGNNNLCDLILMILAHNSNLNNLLIPSLEHLFDMSARIRFRAFEGYMDNRVSEH